jgi:hypothetical protein
MSALTRSHEYMSLITKQHCMNAAICVMQWVNQYFTTHTSLLLLLTINLEGTAWYRRSYEALYVWAKRLISVLQ